MSDGDTVEIQQHDPATGNLFEVKGVGRMGLDQLTTAPATGFICTCGFSCNLAWEIMAHVKRHGWQEIVVSNAAERSKDRAI